MKEMTGMTSLAKATSPSSKAASRMSTPQGGKMTSPVMTNAPVMVPNANGISSPSNEDGIGDGKVSSPKSPRVSSPTSPRATSAASLKLTMPPSPRISSLPNSKMVSPPNSKMVSPPNSKVVSPTTSKGSLPNNSKFSPTKVMYPVNPTVVKTLPPSGANVTTGLNTSKGAATAVAEALSTNGTSSTHMELKAATNGDVEPSEVKTIALNNDSLSPVDNNGTAGFSSPGRPSGLGDNLSRPGSAVSIATVISPTDSVASSKLERSKMTVGEIVQQIESKSANLLKREDFTRQDALADLHFLAQQSRYNSDIHVKRKLVSKMVENGMLEIFIRVYKSVHAADYLRLLSTAKEIDTISEIAENTPDQGDSAKSQSADLLKDPMKDIKEEANDDLRDDQSETRSMCGMDDVRDRKVGKYKVLPDCVKNFRSVITMLSNVTEKSPTLCEDCLRKGIIQMILSDLTDPRLSVPELRDSHKMNIVKGYLGILTNIIRFHSEAREFYREMGAVKVLQHYLKSNLLIIKTRTIMLLSYMINETENDIINAADKNISLLVKVLAATLDIDNHYSRKYGYWAVEIVAGEYKLILVLWR